MSAADYIVVGGGLAGCVVASRLKERLPSSSVMLLEAGTDQHGNPLVTEPHGAFQLHTTPYVYDYTTTPQEHYGGRQVVTIGGNMLSGSSSCNYAMWTRGDSEDYDEWADLVEDGRWSYAGQLPYFKRTEHHFDATASPEAHGFGGPIHTTPVNRSYPLKDPLRQAYDRIGIPANADANSGSPHGYSPYVENWRDGKRQPAGKAYGLKGVDVMTSMRVKQLILAKEDGVVVAKGVETVYGQQLLATKQVILACGAIGSPHILMLSGIGPAEELAKHNIPLYLDAPEVGRNLFDHLAVPLFYKIRRPEEGFCVGSPAFHARDPAYANGLPMDFVTLQNVPTVDMKNALSKDGENENHSLVAKPRNPIELMVVYGYAPGASVDMNLKFDGTCLTAATVSMLPTSRGSIKLNPNNPLDHPQVDPNYYATHADRVVIRTGMRKMMTAMETPEMSAFVKGDIPPLGCPVVTSQSTDDELDARVRKIGQSWFHAAGSCAMGKVVDTDLKVKGVEALRIVDASVYPVPIAAHLRCPTYALAEQAVDIIVQG